MIVGPRHALLTGGSTCPGFSLFDLSTLQLTNSSLKGKKYDVPAEVINLVGGKQVSLINIGNTKSANNEAVLMEEQH